MRIRNNNNKKTIVILGGGLKKEPDGSWRTIKFDAGDDFGLDGGRLRVVAGSYLYKDNPKAMLIALAGKGQLAVIPGAPTVASVIEKELIELGVPNQKIIKEEKSGTTWQQLQELKKIIKDKEVEEIKIISNRFHLPRLKIMIEQDEKLKKMLTSKKIKLQSAEETCLQYESEKWKEIIDKAYNSPAMKERIKLEKKGVKDLKAGKYKSK